MTTIFFTNTGPDRPANEDALLVGDVYSDLSMADPMVALGPETLVAVADGMGGGPGGSTAARVLLEDLNLLPGREIGDPRGHDTLLECLHGTVQRLNRLAASDPSLAGMGATVAGLWRRGPSATVFNCGDCRVYRLREGLLELLSRDHSTVFGLYLDGQITFDGIRSHPKRNLITSAVQESNHNLDLFSRAVRLKNDDLYLLCSDGVWESLTEAELEECLSLPDLELAALRLSESLLAANCGDNFSFLLQLVDRDD
ncbi:MAG: serine/threonine-protein phosphatase [Deltaproteobacteria bacterium]|jgi:serine/threonine protein phosphatase PrpC|nr:serine/threonine-protein phosphatase [Deltaproteobacteria bacterium]